MPKSWWVTAMKAYFSLRLHAHDRLLWLCSMTNSLQGSSTFVSGTLPIITAMEKVNCKLTSKNFYQETAFFHLHAHFNGQVCCQGGGEVEISPREQQYIYVNNTRLSKAFHSPSSTEGWGREWIAVFLYFWTTTPAIHIPYTWHGMLKVHMRYENIYNTSGRCLSLGWGVSIVFHTYVFHSMD